ncbi:MAG TPA: membrane protein insertase YidC [Phycisphaerae bacterium]|nr:membrane protein insertase YidC [Phycisphaerae bacterium]
MERRVLLAISLSFVVLFLYQRMFPPPSEPASPAPASVAAPATPGALSAPTAAPAPVAAPDSVVPVVQALTSDTAEREFVIETQQVRAVFTNRGGRLKNWALKQYPNRAGQLVDLVPAEGNAQPLPFSLATSDVAQTARLNGELYAVENMAPERVDATATPAALTFVYEGADGLSVRKRFTLEPSGYVILFNADVKQGGAALNPSLVWGPGLGDEIARAAGSGGMFSGGYVYPAAGFIDLDGSIKRFAGAAASTAGPQSGAFRYAGITDHYFVSALIEPPGTQRLDFAHVALPDPAEPTLARQLVSYTATFDRPPGDVRVFLGPKQFEALKAINPQFTKVIDFGMFAILAVPLLGALQWVHGYIGNYGWSIIVLTILINLVMWPLRHKSVVSMRKMQELQPQLKAIQDRYAHLKMTDPARGKMNEEVMALYKSKGANPASGCLPMLLTLPVLFAFYSLLSQAIEIRGAPFALWITDLSLRDPWYITPLLMGGTMFWQQRLQPGTGDPVQQKVLMFMPVMFTAMFMTAPSGLVIYWFTSNLWAIGQQYFTNWLIGPAKPAGVKR